MGARLNIDVKDIDDVTYIKLSGVIDEDNELASITERVAQGTGLIDLSDVERINSCGVRDWVTWLGELDKKGRKIYFVEASPAIMTQVNLVNNFLGTGQIVSFYAPYFCASCDSDKMLLVNVEEAAKESPYRAPTCRCDQCDHTMEFDDIETSYFAFLNNIESPQLPDSLRSAINGQAKKGQGLLRSRSTSMPLPSMGSGGGAASTPSSSISVPGMGPTTPSARQLEGLLSEVGQPGQSGAKSGKILYVIVGLLVAAIGLLVYAVVRQ